MQRAMTLGIIVVAISACASGQETMQKQLTDVRQQLLELRKSQARMSVTVEDLETRLFLVQDEMDTARKRMARSRNPERDLPVVRIHREPGASANFDPMADKPVAKVQPEAVMRYDSLDPTGRVIRGNPVPDAGGPKAKSPPTENRKTTKSDRDAMRLYQDSYAHLKGSRFVKALTGFENFVKRFPTHGYADNAVYWMGEAYYARALWLKALQTFQQVLQSYPLGNKAPDAMLKLGLCHQQLKNIRQAREVLRQVREIYPKSPVSKIAAARLEQLR